MENVELREEEAFSVYSQLTETYPESPWLDNAQVHQVKLAEKLAQQGREPYRLFLKDMLASEIDAVRFRAAIALGKAGDKTALPVLYQAQGDEELGYLAADIIKNLESGQSLQSLQTLEVAGEYEKPSVPGSAFTPKHYKQYRAMLRKDDSWTRQELFMFGMWQVLPTQTFEEYASLTDKFDQVQWYEDYWREFAAEVEIPEFEVRNEFERRVFFARGNYSRPAEHIDRKYLEDQYLMPGTFRAPWDARGELYIKYGEPGSRELSYSGETYQENWDYDFYKIDFTVKQYWTNINNSAILKGPIYNPLYDNNPTKFYNDFIEKREFRFNLNHRTNPFEFLKVEIENTPDSEKGNMTVSYSIPADEFARVAFSRENHVISLRGIYVLNDREEEVYSDEEKKIFRVESQGLGVGETLYIDLPAGKYKFFLRVEDYASYKVGSYEKEVIIEEDSKS
jgi:hypothetical protein